MLTFAYNSDPRCTLKHTWCIWFTRKWRTL